MGKKTTTKPAAAAAASTSADKIVQLEGVSTHLFARTASGKLYKVDSNKLRPVPGVPAGLVDIGARDTSLYAVDAAGVVYRFNGEKFEVQDLAIEE